ncbi:aminotransferase class I/II-fold pyridoxal phosphate-dependent enzyme [Nostoc sp. B(2019)]|nr:aminotransferase class I/II-fold pyridoxal phosphate-dependent enzyme [Nostoc sp. B(2019)]
MENFLPFALPDIGEEEIAEVVHSLRSGWLTTGAKTKRFEQDFAEFIGHGVEAIAVNSATSGLHLALEALGISLGDEVITTVHTFTATAEVIRYLGANPVFVDIDPLTLNIDPTKIEAAITPRTKAIMPVHFGGLACDMEPILAIAQKYGLKVVEDAAHAIPTTYQSKLIGSLNSDVTVYSFYATKTIATGEGGMLVTRNPEVAKRCRIMRLHGISQDAFDRYTSTKPSWHYQVVAPGFKYNMTDLAASLGIHQLKKAWIFQKKRAAIANLYDAELANLPLHLPAKPAEGDIHSWHLYVIRLDDSVEVSRNTFIEQLTAKGIGCSVHYIPLHLHPYWRDTYNLCSEDFPCASYAYERIVSLPIYTKMTESDQTRVIQVVKKTLT